MHELIPTVMDFTESCGEYDEASGLRLHFAHTPAIAFPKQPKSTLEV